LGPLFTTLPLLEYFSSPDTLYYLGNTVPYKTAFTLPGVFQDLPFAGGVNGSLWTLPIEAFCYLLLAMVFLVGRRSLILVLPVLALMALYYLWDFAVAPIKSVALFGTTKTSSVARYGFLFLMGAVLWFFKDKIPFKGGLAATCVALLLIGSQIGYWRYAILIFLPYVLLYLAYRKPVFVAGMRKLGDLSYGTYLFAFPIQQSIVSLSDKSINGWWLAIAALAERDVALSQSLAERDATYDSIMKSRSWRLTKPLRRVGQAVRNRKGLLRRKVEQMKVRVTRYLRTHEVENFIKPNDSYVFEDRLERIRGVSVILPIYKDVEMTKRCILAALPSIKSLDNAKLVAINDNSPDSGMQDMLLELQEQSPECIAVLENEINLGFVKTVNRGMKYASLDDVVFLNSDVIVPSDWLARLTTEAYSAQKIGTVTPFSNNATICSFPAFLMENTSAFGLSVEEIDSVFSKQRFPNVIAPTGVGFCMYVRRDCLEEVGLLNEEKFGKGYGEENDLCQRAKKADWLNVITPNLYAFHEGGVSFSSSKQALVEHATKVIAELHPEYHLDVQKFIASDPLKSTRVKRLVQLISTLERPKVLHVSHEAGGGVQQHLDELAKSLEHDMCSLFLTPYRGASAVKLRVGAWLGADELIFRLPEEHDLLLKFLKACGVNIVHYHHTLGLNSALLELPETLAVKYLLTVHDYYWLCGNPTLTTEQGIYPGQYSDEIVNVDFPLPEGMSPLMWRDHLRTFIEKADKVIFPSAYTLSIYEQHYVSMTKLVAAHIEDGRSVFRPVSLTPQKFRYNVGVIGALGREKGADYLEQIVETALAINAPLNFTLIGFGYRQLKGISSTGRYDSTQLKSLIQESELDLIFFPSQCPETYSYTLSYALESGLPIVAPDIGAFPERLSGRDNTLVYRYGTEPAALVNEITSFVTALASGVKFSAPVSAAVPTDHGFYHGEYLDICLSSQAKVHLQIENVDLPKSIELATPPDAPLTSREILLLALWTFYRNPRLQKAFLLVPYSLRQKIKRSLTRRPLHEIVDLPKR